MMVLYEFELVELDLLTLISASTTNPSYQVPSSILFWSFWNLFWRSWS